MPHFKKLAKPRKRRLLVNKPTLTRIAIWPVRLPQGVTSTGTAQPGVTAADPSQTSSGSSTSKIPLVAFIILVIGALIAGLIFWRTRRAPDPLVEVHSSFTLRAPTRRLHGPSRKPCAPWIALWPLPMKEIDS